MIKIWKVKKKAPAEFFTDFNEFPQPIAQLFFNRGLISKQLAANFLNPRMKDLYDPTLLLNMLPAAQRIIQAIKNKEKIAIYGDYDADGICSAAILAKAFNRFGVENYDVFIPNRYKDGYGLTILKVEQMAKLGINLIITVDCGVSDKEEIKLAKNLGMEVLVFDHHILGKNAPDALIVDPVQEGDNYPFKSLAAAGVVYKLVQTLSELLGFPFQESLEKEVIDLVALASIADVMPIIDENRVLVHYGLKQLLNTQNIGLQALLKNTGLDKSNGFSVWHVGFVLAPRINAVGRVRHKTPEGRLESVDYSFGLLTADNEREAEMWAQKINELNIERQKITQKAYDEINAAIEKQGGPEKIIFFGHADWPNGIVGLIAGRLKEEWHRPAFIYSQGEVLSRGSARSIVSYNLVEAMNRAGDILIEPGGHKVSAGFTIKNENIEKFRDFLRQDGVGLTDEDLTPTVEIEAELNANDINPSFLQLYQRFEPFGKENPEPIFLMRSMEPSNVRLVGNGNKHLKLSLEKDGKIFNAIGFGHADKITKLPRGSKVDVVFRLKSNQWQGREYLDLDILDINPVK